MRTETQLFEDRLRQTAKEIAAARRTLEEARAEKTAAAADISRMERELVATQNEQVSLQARLTTAQEAEARAQEQVCTHDQIIYGRDGILSSKLSW